MTFQSLAILESQGWSPVRKVSDYTDDDFLKTAQLKNGVGSFCNIIKWGNGYRDVVVAGIVRIQIKWFKF